MNNLLVIPDESVDLGKMSLTCVYILVWKYWHIM